MNDLLIEEARGAFYTCARCDKAEKLYFRDSIPGYGSLCRECRREADAALVEQANGHAANLDETTPTMLEDAWTARQKAAVILVGIIVGWLAMVGACALVAGAVKL